MMRKYHVALSFAGEQREYVEKVYLYLKEKSNLRVFYDRDKDVHLWGKNILEVLQNIYASEAHFVVMFVSADYVRKMFPTQERRFAIDKAIESTEEYILLARFDDTDIPGVPKSTSYIDLRGHASDPAVFAQKIIDKMTQKGLYFGKSFNADSFRLREVSKNSSTEAVFVIKNINGSLVADADVRLFRPNGTHRCRKSNADSGVVFEDTEQNKFHTIFLAHRDFPAVVADNFENNFDLEITVEPMPGIGSAIFNSTGYIPGFQGRLNPILDSSKRSYLYATNIAINGDVDRQPRYFKFGENINLEDCNGNVVDIRILRIIGNIAILDYIVHK